MKPSKLLIAGAAAAMLPFAAAIAQSPPSPGPASDQTQPTEPAQGAQGAQGGAAQKGVTFESLDTDGDGRISKTEAAANTTVNSQFTRYDQNGNGFIEREEVMSSNQTPPAGGQPPQQ
jgi:hypothetical protein